MADYKSKCFNKDELILPVGIPKNRRIISFDMGGSLCKIAYAVPVADNEKRTKIYMLTFENSDVKEAVQFIKSEIIDQAGKDAEIQAVALGIGSRTDMETFKEVIKLEFEMSDEFTAFAKAFAYMLKNMKEEDYLHPYNDVPVPPREVMGYPPLSERQSRILEETRNRKSKYPALLGFCGSGLGFIGVDENGKMDMGGGSMKAGLFFLSLGRLLTGAKSYNELYKLAEEGNAAVCNTTMLDFKDVEEYGELDVGKMNDSTPFVFEAIPFGNIIRKNLTNPKKEDVARSLMHTTSEEIISWGNMMAREFRTNTVYLAGSFLKNNELAKKYLERFPFISSYFGDPVYMRYIKFEPYMGVLGAVIAKLT